MDNKRRGKNRGSHRRDTMSCDKNMQTYELIDIDLQGAWECCICGAIIRIMEKHTGFHNAIYLERGKL